jgi:O-antigen/teichoic acid export membrane protein
MPAMSAARSAQGARLLVSGLRRHGLFGALMGASSLIGLAKGLVIARVLGVHDFGVYGVSVLVLQFGIFFSNWGILNALNVKLPIDFGRAEEPAESLLDRSFGALTVVALASVLTYLAAVLAIPANHDVHLALVLTAPTVLLMTISELYALVLRVQRRTTPLATVYVARAALALALGIVASLLWGFVGVIVSEFTALFVVILLAGRAWLPRLRPVRPAPGEIGRLVRWGFPLMLANVMTIGALTIDRIFVAAVLPDDFGQYVFATLVVTVWAALVAMLNQVVTPQLLFEFGAGRPLQATVARAWLMTGLLFAAGALAYAPFLALTAWLADGPYSDYADGLVAMRILYLGGLAGLLAFPAFALSALRPRLVTAGAGVAAVTAVAGGALLARADAGLNAFAWLFTVSQVVGTAALLAALAWVVRHHDERSSPA